jgi:PTH1 family peptidyl-tRNA hydrolase
LKLIIGLGNPGRRYAATRHNVGSRVALRFAQTHGIALNEDRFGGLFGSGVVRAEAGGALEVGLLLPQTFMNLSGDAVAAALLGLEIEDASRDLLVVLDDVDLPFGRLRLRPGGGAGGHRGLAHVLERVGRRDLPRLRIGVGRPAASADTVDHVLLPFTPEEERELPGLLERAARALEAVVVAGLATAMNRYNREPEDETAEAPERNE